MYTCLHYNNNANWASSFDGHKDFRDLPPFFTEPNRLPALNFLKECADSWALRTKNHISNLHKEQNELIFNFNDYSSFRHHKTYPLQPPKKAPDPVICHKPASSYWASPACDDLMRSHVKMEAGIQPQPVPFTKPYEDTSMKHTHKYFMTHQKFCPAHTYPITSTI